MVNKIDGIFTKSDEESFEAFATYCGLALHHAKVSSIVVGLKRQYIAFHECLLV